MRASPHSGARRALPSSLPCARGLRRRWRRRRRRHRPRRAAAVPRQRTCMVEFRARRPARGARRHRDAIAIAHRMAGAGRPHAALSRRQRAAHPLRLAASITSRNTVHRCRSRSTATAASASRRTRARMARCCGRRRPITCCRRTTGRRATTRAHAGQPRRTGPARAASSSFATTPTRPNGIGAVGRVLRQRRVRPRARARTTPR